MFRPGQHSSHERGNRFGAMEERVRARYDGWEIRKDADPIEPVSAGRYCGRRTSILGQGVDSALQCCGLRRRGCADRVVQLEDESRGLLVDPRRDVYSVRVSTPQREDWAAVLDGLVDGDRASLLKLTRLINGFFVRWNAYDFRDDWEDLIQEVLMASIRAQRDGRVRDRAHVYGFLKTITRNKFVDRLKSHLSSPADKSLPWEEIVDSDLDPGTREPEPGVARDVEVALEALDERRRRVILAVYVEGQTHQEAVVSTGIPLGSVRRYLREGLAELQRALDPGARLENPVLREKK